MNHEQLSVENVFPTLTTLFAISNLVGCGLRGPLYFLPMDETAPPPAKPISPGTQSSTSDYNGRDDTGGPSQVNYQR